jgi:hypothetical protein
MKRVRETNIIVFGKSPMKRLRGFCMTRDDADLWVRQQMVNNKNNLRHVIGLVMKYLFDKHTVECEVKPRYWQSSIEQFVPEDLWIGNISMDYLWDCDESKYCVLNEELRHNLNTRYWKSLGYGYSMTFHKESNRTLGYVIPSIQIEVDDEIMFIPGDSYEDPINLE